MWEKTRQILLEAIARTLWGVAAPPADPSVAVARLVCWTVIAPGRRR